MKKFALISVSKKSIKLIELCRELLKNNYEIIATKGSKNFLNRNGIKCFSVEEFTKISEYLGGKIKTIHPLIHAMILVNKENKEEVKEINQLNLGFVELLIVNFYELNFLSFNSFLNSIDIGGRTLINSAIKNFKNVAILIEEKDYEKIIKELKRNGKISNELKKELALKALDYLINYESKIYSYLYEKLTNNLAFIFLVNKGEKLKYGENPHQKAYLFEYKTDPHLKIKKIHGDVLTYNNYLDIDKVLTILSEFEENSCVIIKHTNPCSVASAENLKVSFIKAYESDKISAYGGIVGLSGIVNEELASILYKHFFDIIIAKKYEKDALELLKKKKKTKIIECENLGRKLNKNFSFRTIINGLLLQEKDLKEININELKFVSERKPNEEELKDMLFAWKVVKHVFSNAIVIAKNKVTLGIGCGQMNRIESVKIALEKAGEKAKKAVLASDGFFPFRDSIDLAAEKGITAIIEPGGSIRDKEVIKAANEKNIALVFTGIRVFKH